MSVYPSLAPFVQARPWLRNALKPLANWYANAAGYRQLGLRYVFSLSSAAFSQSRPGQSAMACIHSANALSRS